MMTTPNIGVDIMIMINVDNTWRIHRRKNENSSEDSYRSRQYPRKVLLGKTIKIHTLPIRLSMRPSGVVSKNDIGERRRLCNSGA